MHTPHRWSKLVLSIGLLKRLQKSNPTAAQISATLAEAYAAHGDYLLAQTAYNEALRLEPNDAQSQYALGKMQLDHGDISAATTHLEAAAKASPDSGLIHYELARAYRQSSRLKDAERETRLYESLKAAHPTDGAGARPN